MSTTTKVDFVDFLRINSATGTDPTTGKIIVGCNGKVFYGGFGSWTASTGGVYDNTAAEITTVGASQNWYLVDGTNYKVIDGANGSVSNFAAAEGSLPSGARIVTLYRNRLVFARTATDPHDWFMSAVGAYDDFDYGNTDNGVAIAIAGNNSDAGKIGDVITCLIPFSDDYMVMGCSDSTWLMRGDPATGGRIDNLTHGGGIVGPHAFARDAEGNIYFLSRTDLMMIQAGGSVPTSISQGRISKFMSEIDFSAVSARLAWDQQSKSLWIFLTPAASGAASHLHWDRFTDAFTPHSFPNDHGPTAVCDLAGVVYQERQIIMGGFDGRLRTMDPAWITDDGTAISSHVALPPVPLGDPTSRGIIAETELVLGDVGFPHVLAQWYVGDNPQAAIAAGSAATSIDTTATGRVLYRGRARGQTGVLKLSNSRLAKTFAYESGTATITPGGRTR